MKYASIATVIAAATLALPAAAGWVVVPPQSAGGFVTEAGDAGSTPESYAYVRTQAAGAITARTATVPQAAAAPGPADFEFVAGEAGSQPLGHKLVRVDGKLVHSPECDHAIRSAQAPTRAEVEGARIFSPGA